MSMSENRETRRKHAKLNYGCYPGWMRRAGLWFVALLAVLAVACLSGCLPWSDYDRDLDVIAAVAYELHAHPSAYLDSVAMVGATAYWACESDDPHVKTGAGLQAMRVEAGGYWRLTWLVYRQTGILTSRTNACEALLVVGLRAHHA